MQIRPPLEVGSLIPNFKLASTSGTSVSPNDLVGKALVIFFYLRDGGESCTHEVRGFRDLHREFEKLGVVVLGIGIEPVEGHRHFAASNDLPFPLLSDPAAETFAAFGAVRAETVQGQTVAALSRSTFLFGPDFRVLKAYVDVSAPDHPAHVLDDATKLLLRDEPRRIIRHAPVLIIPDVLPPQLCQALIQAWQTQNEDSGFMKQVEGQTVGMLDYSHKIRRDHFLKAGELETRLQRYLAARVVPEVQKSFNYAITRREDFRIACYDASRGGYFRPHRDNTTDGTAHRRFAMSLLLNDEYEGGYLRFPEYGGHTYRPDAGGAVIFSCSLLHEATDVTAGRRFVLLSFFYGEAEAKAREEYNKRTGGSYRAAAQDSGVEAGRAPASG